MAGTVLITTSSFDTDLAEIKALENAGYTIRLNPHKRKLTEDEIAALLTPDVIGLIAGVEPLTRRVLTGAKHLKSIARCGAGLDSVDLAAAKDSGITVTNTPDAPTQAVAELTLGLMLAALRGIAPQDRSIRAGAWDRPMGRLLGGCTLGLVGLGRIGRAVGTLASGFGAKILGHDPAVKNADPIVCVPLKDLLAAADIVSLHIPVTQGEKPLADAAFFAAMKPGALFVNTARGELVDETALENALRAGHLGGAALDVFAQEPYRGSLAQLPNVVLTAHTGSYARETRARQEAEAAANLLESLTG